VLVAGTNFLGKKFMFQNGEYRKCYQIVKLFPFRHSHMSISYGFLFPSDFYIIQSLKGDWWADKNCHIFLFRLYDEE
jgi:hypothetical protein